METGGLLVEAYGLWFAGVLIGIAIGIIIKG